MDIKVISSDCAAPKVPFSSSHVKPKVTIGEKYQEYLRNNMEVCFRVIVGGNHRKLLDFKKKKKVKHGKHVWHDYSTLVLQR